MPKILPDARARQGGKGRPVLMVLIGSFLLIGLYLVAMMLWSGSKSPDSTAQNASRTEVTGSASGSQNPTARTPAANPAYPVRSDMTTGTANPSGTGDGSAHQQQEQKQ